MNQAIINVFFGINKRRLILKKTISLRPTPIAYFVLGLCFAVAVPGLPARSQNTFTPQTTTLNPVGHAGFLTGPQQGDPVALAIAYIHQNQSGLNLTDTNLDQMRLQTSYASKQSGITHVFFEQILDEIPVHGTWIAVNVARDGSIINARTNFVAVSEAGTRAPREAMAAADAAVFAANHLGLEVSTPITALSAEEGPRRSVRLSDGGFAREPISAELVYEPVAQDQVRLAWFVDFKDQGGPHHWQLRVDGLDGRILSKNDLVISDRFYPEAMKRGGPSAPKPLGALGTPSKSHALGIEASYEVFAMPSEYPDDGPRVVVNDPADGTASPFGWHDTDGAAGPEFTITRGNNTHTFLDRNNNNQPDPGADVDGGAALNFTGALVPLDLSMQPDTYSNAAVVNNFYWVNTLHDVLYGYGFDEPSGNFQVNNYGNGGLGGDDVIAYTQKGADVGVFNNAFFGTPSDGSRPEMLMHVFTSTSPRRDSAFSSTIMSHEFGHGVSNRLTGGPQNVNCLGNLEQMGEGWGDFLALVFTAKDTDLPDTFRGAGTYVLGQPVTGPGIRPARYTTDMAVNGFTYGNVNSVAIPHGVGFIWCTMLWEMYWELVLEHGFNPDLFGDWSTGGNNLALQLVMDGMKLQACSPGFVDGRDAILQADMALTGGANQCLIWKAFAKRGLGFSASQGSSGSVNDGMEAFDMPPSCLLQPPTPGAITVCAGGSASFDLMIGAGFATPLTVTVSGAPTGSTVIINPDPINAVPVQVEITVIPPVGAPADDYDLTIQVDDGSAPAQTDATLTVVTLADTYGEWGQSFNILDLIPCTGN